jgi:acetate---CoA ligase (ADP-forming) subunit beta
MTVKAIIDALQKEKRARLTEIESKEFIKEAGIPVVDSRPARFKKQAIEISKEVGFPVALKILSPDILHKSDSGGVKLGLENATQVGNAYDEILLSAKQHFPEAVIEGVSVQKMARPGTEVIIGMTKDAQFGPVLMFGLGGVLVEVLKDVSFRVVPLSKRDAHEMIREIKGYPLLEGYRGQEAADISFLEDVLVKLSGFIDRHPEIQELDLNPVFAYKDGAIAVDARVILESIE